MQKQILIIENDADILDILCYALTHKGYKVIQSHDPLNIAAILSLKPDLIMLDEWLDYSHGSEICTVLKANTETCNIPVLLVSAVADISFIARNCGADGFIKKPFDLSEVEVEIDNLLNRTVAL